MWWSVEYWLSATLALAVATVMLALLTCRILFCGWRLLDDLQRLSAICPGVSLCLCDGFFMRIGGTSETLSLGQLHRFVNDLVITQQGEILPVAKLREILAIWCMEGHAA